MNKIFLHVGPHKTGTTLIQKFMLDNQTKLLNSKLFYPKQLVRIFGHHEFRDRLKDKSLRASDIEFIKKYDGNVLLSSEDLISLNEDHFKYLKSCFSGYQIEVIYAWRRASTKLYSIWQETIKHGGVEPFFEYHHSHLASPAQSFMLSADLKVAMFSRVFGKDAIHILDYDASAKNDSLIKDFLSIVNVEWDETFSLPNDNPHAANRAMSYVDTEIIRALNYMFLHRYDIKGTQVRVWFTEMYAQLNEQQLNKLKSLIEKSKIEIDAGKYFVDQRAEKVMLNNFSENILNYQKPDTKVLISVANQAWLLESESKPLLEGLFNQINELKNVH